MSLPERPLHRSYLYAPGSRPDLCRKALAAGADAVILDLEDAVAPAYKAAARDEVAELLPATTSNVGCAVHVRVNRAGQGFDSADVAAVVTAGLDALRLPKTEHPEAVTQVAQLVDEAEAAAGLTPGAIGLYPTIESAAGMLAAGSIARAPRVRRLAFGSTDFLADIGVPSGEDERDATLVARTQLVLVSRAAGIGPPIDSVHTHVADLAGLRTAAAFARSLGFFGKSIIHPRQLAAVHEVFTPRATEVAHAREVLAACAQTPHAADLIDGHFVDPAVAARARATVELAEALEQREERTP